MKKKNTNLNKTESLFINLIPYLSNYWNKKTRRDTGRESHPLELVASFLPAGTLSGAPKIRAMEIIDELEVCRRGLYGGATGYLAFDGNMDFCITIRTMVKKQKKVYLLCKRDFSWKAVFDSA